MDTKLGTLKNVNLREAWSHEAQDFTPWPPKTSFKIIFWSSY